MVFEAIERQQRELTDKYVIVTGTQPELARFEGVVGRVKTVNMSGRALVEFNGLHNNVGWFDIDPTFLRVIDKPPEVPATPAAKGAKAAPASKIPAKAPAKSAADILAAARGGVGAKPTATGAGKLRSPSVGKSPADILAAARASAGRSTPAAPAAPAPAPSAPSDKAKRTSPAIGLATADVLAAARAKAITPSAKDPAAGDAALAPRQKPPLKNSTMTTAEILAAARAKNAPPAPPQNNATAVAADAVDAPPAGPRRLSAGDILAIANGQQSLRREQPVHTEPRPKQPTKDDAGVLHGTPDRTMITAADIRAMGDGGRPRSTE
jgi:hypothetical protein